MKHTSKKTRKSDAIRVCLDWWHRIDIYFKRELTSFRTTFHEPIACGLDAPALPQEDEGTVSLQNRVEEWVGREAGANGRTWSGTVVRAWAAREDKPRLVSTLHRAVTMFL